MDLLQRARDLYGSGRMHDALEAAQAACDRAPKDSEAWWLLGRVSRHAGLPAASDEAFRRAHTLGARHPVPHRVTAERFRELIEEARAVRPSAAAVRCQLIPSPEQVRAGLDPDALVLTEPDQAPMVFQVNHENRCGSEGELRKLVRRSVLKTSEPSRQD
jgi:hypothetical protein